MQKPKRFSSFRSSATSTTDWLVSSTESTIPTSDNSPLLTPQQSYDSVTSSTKMSSTDIETGKQIQNGGHHDKDYECRTPQITGGYLAGTIDIEDAERIQQTINIAGNDSFGILAVDLWIMNEQDEKLYHFGDSGLNWISNVYTNQLIDEERSDALDALHKLQNEIDDTEAEISGAGLAGNFWQMYGSTAGSSSNLNQQLVWHDLREFTTNPFQMPSERLQALGKVFGRATGIPFNILGRYKGVVLYFVRREYDEVGVNSNANTAYLHFSANQIGSVAAMSETRTKAISKRKEKLAKAAFKFRLQLSVMKEFKRGPSERKLNVQNGETYNDDEFIDNLSYRKKNLLFAKWDEYKHILQVTFKEVKRQCILKTQTLVQKSMNPPLKAPPSTSWGIAIWNSMVCFLAFMSILGINEAIKNATKNDYSIILGPFGALITLQYTLTAAPPSQPSNCIFGMIICLAVPMGTKQLLHDLAGFPQWIVACIGSSLAVGMMCKTGVVHPPAGATAIVFSMSKKSFTTDLVLAGFMIFADVVAILLAMVLNNVHDTRQYPMYPMWHLGVPPKGLKDD